MPAGTYYWRRLQNRTRVYYDTLGRQVWVRDRVGQKARYAYRDTTAASPLDTIQIAPQAADLVYTFTYDHNQHLDDIFDPASRRLNAIVDASGRLAELYDPGIVPPHVAFGYDASMRLVTWRSRRHHTTFYGYLGPTALLATDTLPGIAVTDFTPVRAQGYALLATGLNTTVPAEDAAVVIDGPRTDVADVARFWVNRFGAPDSIQNALGHRTRIMYDPAHPLLPVEVVQPNGHRITAHYNDRALADSVVQHTHSAGRATQHFTYDSQWNLPSEVVNPEGDAVSYEYDPANGNLLKVEESAGRVTEFTYYTDPFRAGLVDTVTVYGAGDPGNTSVEQYQYSNQGNLTEARTARGGIWTFTHHPTGLVHTATDPDGLEARTEYDAMGRDTLVVRTHPTEPDTIISRKKYDGDGNLERLTDPWARTTQWAYDGHGRVRFRTDPAGARDTMVYDLAGNLVETHTRRGLVIRHQYDALNRPTHTYVPETSDTLLGVPHTSSADTSTFDYDELGNITEASNRVSTVIRTYTPEGALETEQLQIGTHSNPTDRTTYVYDVAFEYDRNGRLIELEHPRELWLATGPNVYDYDGPTGRLMSMAFPAADTLTRTFSYGYDARGRRTSIAWPNGTSTTFGYFEDGQIRFTRHVTPCIQSDCEAQGATQFASPAGVMALDSLERNLVGSVTTRFQEISSVDTVWSTTYQYDGFQRLTVFDASTTIQGAREEFTYSKAGDRLTHTYPFLQDPEELRYFYDDAGRLHTATGPATGIFSQTWHADGSLRTRDGQKRGMRFNGSGMVPTLLNVQSAFGYDGLGRTVAIETFQGGVGIPAEDWSIRNWYDALGRRVARIASRNGPPARIIRFVYAGTEPVFTVTTEAALDSDTTTFLWKSFSVHDPLSGHEVAAVVFDLNAEYYLHRNEQGTLRERTLIDGMGPGDSNRDGQQASEGPLYLSHGDPTTPESGLSPESVLDGYTGAAKDGGSAAGLVFLKNRYYDPSTGRFTQEDPIGFAGGINLYAYAGNNPATYTDPFGLCPPEWLCKLKEFGRNFVAGFTAMPGDQDTGPGWLAGARISVLTGGLGRGIGLAAREAGATARAIRLAEEFVGEGATMKINKAGDAVFVSKDGTRRLRFDINRPHPHQSPHAHIDELVDGKWQTKRIYPTDVPHR